MKCPVCTWEHPTIPCPRCGFDSSRDYEKYPTFGIVGTVPAASALRKKWSEKQKPEDPIEPTPVKTEPAAPAQAEKPRKILPWLMAVLACITVTVLIVGWFAAENPVWKANVLKKDSNTSSYVYGTVVPKHLVKSVTFLDTLEDAPAGAIDVSADQDGSVRLWTIRSAETYDLYFAANGGINGKEACHRMFASYTNLESIDSLANLHTDEVQNMSSMFDGCYRLKTLDLSSFNTVNVRDMSSMFKDCYLLKTLDFSGFDTGNVQRMNSMFYNCNSLAVLDLTSFDTGNVQYMNSMFSHCNSLNTLDLSSFDTGTVKNMSSMFNFCYSLKKLDLSSFDTSNVRYMNSMFYYSYSLKELNLSNRFVTTNADTTSMFFHCPAGDDWQHLLH